MRTCKRVHYWGTVQGVGFRMMTLRIARQHTVFGYVRNLANGQVEVLVTGQPDEVQRFLTDVEARMASYIQGHRIEDADDEPTSFTTFEIWH